LLNIKLNRTKLVDVCGYKLTTNGKISRIYILSLSENIGLSVKQ